jgi:hypothetical protein
VKLAPSSLGVLIMFCAASSYTSTNQGETPSLTGRWVLEFNLSSGTHRLQFDGRASGEGSFVSLDPSSSVTPPLTPLKAMWSLKGQSSAIFYFSIVGDVAFPTSDGRIETGRIELAVSSDLTLPISSLSGSGQFHSSQIPDDTRGREDPAFSFTGRRASTLIVQLVSPSSGAKLRRGKESLIEWKVQSPAPLVSQELFISFDGGESFVILAADLPGDARNFLWPVPEALQKTKRALIKIVVTDIGGSGAEGLSEQPFRIK